jgi:prepilin peptidase CpaA
MINPIENYTMMFFLLIVTSIAAAVDVRTHKIPNLVTFPAMAAAAGYYTIFYGWGGFCFSFGGLLVGIALLLLPYLLGGMGAGDAKLMGAIGAAIGAERVIIAFVFIVSVGCLYGLLVIIFQRHRLKGYFKQLWHSACGFVLTRRYIPAQSNAEDRPKVYYGIAIGAGTMIYVTMEITAVGALA